MHELRPALDRSKSRSPGPDFVPVFLKQMTDKQLQFILEFYNHVWNNGLPEQRN